MRLRGLSRLCRRGRILCSGLHGGLLRFGSSVAHLKAALAAAWGRQCGADSAVDRVEHIALFGKADLGLGRVDVDIDEVGGHFQHQHGAGELALHHRAFVGVFQCGHHRAVFDVAAIDEEMLCPAAGAAGTGRRDQAGDFVQLTAAVHRQKVTGKLAPQHGVHGAAQVAVAGGQKLLLAVAQKAEADLRVGQCRVQNGLGHKGAFARVLFQELHAGGSVVEQFVDRDSRAHGARAGLHALRLAALNAVAAGILVSFGAGQNFDLGDTGDGCKRLAAEAQRVDMAKILCRGNFAGGMADKRFVDIFCLDARAVIGNLQLRNAAARGRKGDLGRPGINGIFQKLLSHTGRAFYDFTGCDQFGGMLVQHTNFRHGSHLPLFFV